MDDYASREDMVADLEAMKHISLGGAVVSHCSGMSNPVAGASRCRIGSFRDNPARRPADVRSARGIPSRKTRNSCRPDCWERS